MELFDTKPIEDFLRRENLPFRVDSSLERIRPDANHLIVPTYAEGMCAGLLNRVYHRCFIMSRKESKLLADPDFFPWLKESLTFWEEKMGGHAREKHSIEHD